MAMSKYSEHERNVARRWWDDVGRGLISRQINPDDTETRVRTGGPAPAIVSRQIVDAKIPSGILNGLAFDQLTEREQLRVIACFQYAHERERYPDRRHDQGENRAKRLKLDGERVTKLAVPWRTQ